jgi:hypothetical protein
MIGIGIGVAHANYVKAIAPTGLTISIVSTGLKLDWTNVAGNTGYQVYNSTDNITYAQIGADLAANAVTYTHVIATGILNYYKIRTVKNGKYSDFTAVVSAIPAIYFTLTKTGDGTGVSTLAMTVSENITLTLSANATFYTDAAGTLNASQTWNITTGASRTIYIKCTTGTATLTIPKAVITSWGRAVASGWASITNAASLSGDISKLRALTLLNCSGINDLTGSIAGLTSLTNIYARGNIAISGDISGLGALTILDLTGVNTLSGNISAMTQLTNIWIAGSNTLSGSVTNLTNLVDLVNDSLYMTLSGSVTNLTKLVRLRTSTINANTIGGDLNPIVSDLTVCTLFSCAMVDYTAGAVWTNIFITINPSAGYGYSSTEIDNMLIDMAASNSMSGKTITLQGSSQARTAASNTAVTKLTTTNSGYTHVACTVVTN